MNCVFLGPPGCGKGTQGAILKEKFGFLHVCAGDLLRCETEKKSPLGLEIEAIINAGNMVNDDVISSLIRQYVKEHEECDQNTSSVKYIMDGYPRSIRQSNDLDSIFSLYGKEVHAVFYFDIAFETLVKRISGRLICKDCHAVYHETLNPPSIFGVCDACCGRSLLKRNDDNVKILENRLIVFEENTKPVVSFYEKQGKLVRIHADQAVDAVTCELNEHFARLDLF